VTDPRHSLNSSEREEYVEYIFLAELCSCAWIKHRLVEITRAQTDAFGYDLVISEGKFTRHLQLKASVVGDSTRTQKVNVALERKASGCVLWLKIDESTLRPSAYCWYGSDPGQPLPDLGEKVQSTPREIRRAKKGSDQQFVNSLGPNSKN
jgi:hypothetical protein